MRIGKRIRPQKSWKSDETQAQEDEGEAMIEKGVLEGIEAQSEAMTEVCSQC